MPEHTLEDKVQANSPFNDGWTREYYKNKLSSEEYLGASNGIAGAKLPLAPEDRQYPEHDKLIEHIMDLVAGNIEGGRDCMHAREMLDDILVDLTYLKNAIGTPEQYLKKGML